MDGGRGRRGGICVCMVWMCVRAFANEVSVCECFTYLCVALMDASVWSMMLWNGFYSTDRIVIILIWIFRCIPQSSQFMQLAGNFDAYGWIGEWMEWWWIGGNMNIFMEHGFVCPSTWVQFFGYPFPGVWCWNRRQMTDGMYIILCNCWWLEFRCVDRMHSNKCTRVFFPLLIQVRW